MGPHAVDRGLWILTIRSIRTVVRRRARRRLYTSVFSPISAVRHSGHDLADTAILVGVMRSGTTWIQELLADAPGTCPIFEPFARDPRFIELCGRLDPVIPIDGDEPGIEAHLRLVMRGGRVTPWSMRLTSVPELLGAERFVVKHVQLNLAVGWMGRRFADSPMIVLVRHPCAVVESLLRVSWAGGTAEAVLARRAEPERARMLELVDRSSSLPAVFAAMWAVQVDTLLRETDPSSSRLVVYEAAAADPVGVLGPVMESTGLPRGSNLTSRATQPSRTTQSSAVLHGGARLDAWVDRLSVAQRAEVLEIVERSGIAGYGADPRPDVEALHEQHARTTVG